MTLSWSRGPMPRRLEDRIKDLCVKAIAASDSVEFHDIFKELQNAPTSITSE